MGAEGQPPLAGIDPMLRRRAGRLGRLALEPLLSCGAVDLPVVFCSRHGEAQRSVGLLRSLSAGEPLSPTEFSLAVHNAIGGLHSIASGSRVPVTAIAGGASSPAQGLIEAFAQLDDATPEVALVVYDSPLPQPYDRDDDESGVAFGWTWVLARASEGAISLSWGYDPELPDEACSEPFGLSLLRAYLAGGAHRLSRDGVYWQWRPDA